MANKLYEENSVQAIANAIRTKNGLSTTYKIAEMADAILALPTGSGETNYLPYVLNDSSSGYTLPSGALTGVTKIRSYAFYEANITAISFPNTLTEVEDHAFTDSYLAGTITIPASVTALGKACFKGTAGRTFVIEATTPPTIVNDTFGGLPDQNLAIYVPDDSLSAYRSAWSYYYQVIHPVSDIVSP